MPKTNLKNPFARRKSSGNVLESPVSTEAPAQSSFRVIERPEKTKIILDGPDRRASNVPRPFASPLESLRGKSVDDLTYSAGGTVDTAASRRSAASLQKLARGSGGTANSNSSEFYQSSSASARHSSSSTLPSSIDPDNENESDGEFTSKWAAAGRKPLPLTPEEPLPVPPSFSARAQRAFSFGLGKKPAQDTNVTSPTVPARPSTSHSPTRERALTTSSYASTAVPHAIEIPKHDFQASDFSDDFGDMFETLGKSRVEPFASSPIAHRTDSPPIYPPKSYSSQSYTPSQHGLKGMGNENDSPYTQTRRTSRDALLDSSAANSPQLGRESRAFFPGSKQEYSLVSNETSPNLSKQSSQEYLSASAGASTSPSAAVSANASTDDVQRYELRDPQETPLPAARQPTIRFSAIPPLATIGQLSDDMEMVDITSKATNRQSAMFDDEPLFDAKPINAARKTPIAAQSKSEPALPKRMTKAQFEILKQYPERSTDSTDHGDSGDEYDDVDEAERLKQVTTQRRKQEANMALYRQQMKKVTGGGPTDLPTRPSVDRAASGTPSLHLGGIPATPPPEAFRPKQQNDDEDDDIPLAILQAHGFPSAARAPSQIMDGSPGYRPVSTAPRNSQSLPPFARRLPEDPYFGAGLVNSGARESLAFGGGASVYGGPASQPNTPGGLVGIIATEERQRQARRGSPNAQTGTFPLPANMPGPMNRNPSMASMQAPMFYPGNMQGMPMMMPQMPGADGAQLQQFMQAQMAMMQNMQNMIHMQQAQINGQMPPRSASPIQPGLPRPDSIGSNLGLSNQGRAMSMMGTPSSWNLGMATPRVSTYAPSMNGLGGPGAGYTPSIAPSERSNVGQPSRYRPVTSSGENEGRTNSFTSSQTLNAFRYQQGAATERPQSQHMQQSKSTIRVIDKPKGLPRSPNAENDDDDDGNWADMAAKKRLKAKRGDRASKTGEDRPPLSELYLNVE